MVPARSTLPIRFAVAILAAGASILSGCAGRPVSRIDVGSYVFASGEFTGRVSQPVAGVKAAVEQALAKAGVTGVAGHAAGPGFALAGQDSTGRRVEVRLRPEGQATRVTISIGNVGDEAKSAELFGQIAELSAHPTGGSSVTEPVTGGV